jgi:predicted secreted hydrolase
MPRPGLSVIVVLAVLGLGTWAVLGWLARDAESPLATGVELGPSRLEALAEAFPAPDDASLEWPRDHGSRPEQLAESWLFAGLLRDDAGARYGFELAFQRLALSPEAPARDSAWATREVFRAWFALAPEGEAAHAGERLSRAAQGLAGAGQSPPRVWLEDWAFRLDEAANAMLLRAGEAGALAELRIDLPEHGPAAIDGGRYRGYWWPGLAVTGNVALGERRLRVSGRAMMERLWGKGLPIGQGQLALVRLWLDDGGSTALRCQQLRRKAGGGSPLQDCQVYGADTPVELALDVVETGWRDTDGLRLPLHWQLQLPAAQQPVELAPLARPGVPRIGGAWSGVLAVPGRSEAWGLLDLSNFGTPGKEGP